MPSIEIRPLREEDIPAVARMEYEAWHDYYRQYPGLYETIASQTTLDNIAKDWREFISDAATVSGPIVTGQDRAAYVALIDGEPGGISAASSYVEGKWEPVDEILRRADGTLPKVTKFQNLYIHKDHRGRGLGHLLGIARANYMLDKGYTGMFLTTYADAHKTNDYHEKNGMKRVHEYWSMQTYDNGQKVKIACFLQENLQGLRDEWQDYVDRKIKAGKAFAAIKNT